MPIVVTLPFWYFNSIKVRLELCAHRSINPLGAFQFHKGTIRTTFSHLRSECNDYFNSIKVRLEQENPREICVKLDYFNSIKVRLELPTGELRI